MHNLLLYVYQKRIINLAQDIQEWSIFRMNFYFYLKKNVKIRSQKYSQIFRKFRI